MRLICFLLSLAFLAVLPPSMRSDSSAQSAPIDVDIELLLGLDISYSMDLDELAIQREGYAQAFRSPEIKRAIAAGQLGRIAVMIFDWASYNDQRVSVPWTLLDTPESIDAFADRISTIPIRRASKTSISGAIDFGVAQLDGNRFKGTRVVMDISGDGPNNDGRPVLTARAGALAKGITINGLPIVLKRGGWSDIEDLDEYYKECVIGGPRAFMVPIRARDEFIPAIRTKLLLEIADLQPSSPSERLIRPTQAYRHSNLPDCLVGERQFRERFERGN